MFILSTQQITHMRNAETIVFRHNYEDGDHSATLECVMHQLPNEVEPQTFYYESNNPRAIAWPYLYGSWVNMYLAQDNVWQTFVKKLRKDDRLHIHFVENGCDKTREAGLDVHLIRAEVFRDTRSGEVNMQTYYLGMHYQSEYKYIHSTYEA